MRKFKLINKGDANYMIRKIKEKIKIPYLQKGCKNIWTKKFKMLFPLAFLISCYILWWSLTQKIGDIKLEWLSTSLIWSVSALSIVFTVFGTLLIISFIGTPCKAKAVEQALHRIKLVDRTDTPPLLIDRYKEAKADVFEFFSPAISLSDFEKKRTDIETALNTNIVDIKAGQDFQHILVKTISSNKNLTQTLLWDNSMMSENENVIVLGENILGERISADMSKDLHWLIAGISGSGKSAFLRTIAMQFIEKGYEVYVNDSKSALDFNKKWKDKCEVIKERSMLIRRLDYIIKEKKVREELFEKTGCKDIYDYNSCIGNLKQIVLICDEVGELCDTTGRSKEEKEEILCIIGYLQSISRAGRASGIHLILSTQRPSVDIIPNEIRNNLGFRICGRGDSTLVKMVLDSVDEADKLNNPPIGVFLTKKGDYFKAYYFDDSMWG